MTHVCRTISPNLLDVTLLQSSEGAGDLSRVQAVMLGKRGAAPLYRLYKAKERNGALYGSRAYIHGGTVLNNTARCLRPAGGSPLVLDPSHVPVWSRGSAYP